MNIDLLFRALDGQEILPLLAGYFFRTNLCLYNNRYKETVERVYAEPAIFNKMINHSEHMAISGTIVLYLNLDTSKSSTSEEKLKIKREVLKNIVRRISQESQVGGAASGAIV